MVVDKRTPTIAECIDLIRKYKALPTWNDSQIAVGIIQALNDKCLATAHNDITDELEGIVFGTWHNSCSLHIICIAGKHSSLKKFLKYLKKTFPHARTITANRNGEEVIYKIQ